MNIVGMMPARNEDWVISTSARAAMKWCDQLILLDHASTDSTLQVMRQVAFDHPMAHVFTSRATEWDEMKQREGMLNLARKFKATHLAIIDADEIVTANLVQGESDSLLRQAVQRLKPGEMLSLPGYNLRAGLDRYHSNGVWGTRWFSTVFMDDPRANYHGHQFHHREPFGVDWKQVQPIMQGVGGTMHLWGASEVRLRAKHALYKVTEAIQFPNKDRKEIDRMYSWAIYGDPENPGYGIPGTWDYRAVPREWWGDYARPEIDGTPWQAAETQKIVKANNWTLFQGLDLFGVA